MAIGPLHTLVMLKERLYIQQFKFFALTMIFSQFYQSLVLLGSPSIYSSLKCNNKFMVSPCPELPKERIPPALLFFVMVACICALAFRHKPQFNARLRWILPMFCILTLTISSFLVALAIHADQSYYYMSRA